MTLCKGNGMYIFATQKEETTFNHTERVIEMLKTMLYQYFTKYRTYKYLDVLQDFVKTYNATPHRSLNNIAHKDINKKNEASIFGY